jgi:hypothetical protein
MEYVPRVWYLTQAEFNGQSLTDENSIIYVALLLIITVWSKQPVLYFPFALKFFSVCALPIEENKTIQRKPWHLGEQTQIFVKFIILLVDLWPQEYQYEPYLL